MVPERRSSIAAKSELSQLSANSKLTSGSKGKGQPVATVFKDLLSKEERKDKTFFNVYDFVNKTPED